MCHSAFNVVIMPMLLQEPRKGPRICRVEIRAMSKEKTTTLTQLLFQNTIQIFTY